VRIEGGTVRIERLYVVPELHGDGAGRRVRASWLSGRGFFFHCANIRGWLRNQHANTQKF
jgi:hypothetical protein